MGLDIQDVQQLKGGERSRSNSRHPQNNEINHNKRRFKAKFAACRNTVSREKDHANRKLSEAPTEALPQDQGPSETNAAVLQGQDSVNVFIGIRQQRPLTRADREVTAVLHTGTILGTRARNSLLLLQKTEHTAVSPGEPTPRAPESPR